MCLGNSDFFFNVLLQNYGYRELMLGKGRAPRCVAGLRFRDVCWSGPRPTWRGNAEAALALLQEFLDEVALQ